MCVLLLELGAELELSPQDQHSNGVQSFLTPPSPFWTTLIPLVPVMYKHIKEIRS